MANLPTYSTLFSCIHDEAQSVGNIGRGSHYSVLRSVEWLDVTRSPVHPAQIHDFAVIWDEDHDSRVIEAIELIYLQGLLSPVQFIGERKGFLTLVLAAKFWFWGSDDDLIAYQHKIEAIAQGLNDPWTVSFGCFDRQPGSPTQTFPGGIIQDDEFRVVTYMRTIDHLWRLGTKSLPASSPY